MFFDRFNPAWALAFLISFLHYWTQAPSQHYPQISCLHFSPSLNTSFLCLNGRSCSSIQVSYCFCLTYHSCIYVLKFLILEDVNLEHQWLVLELSCLQDSLPWGSFTLITEETKGCSSKYVIPTLVLLLLFRILPFCMIIAAVAARAFTRQILSCL